MGISKFYGQWVAKLVYPGLINKRVGRKVAALMLDMNGIIHECAQVVYGYGNGDNKEVARVARETPAEAMEFKLFEAINVRLSELVEELHPTQWLVMAVDGPAILAKVSQQRSRRFKSGMTHVPDAGEKNGELTTAQPPPEPPAFNSNCITPGTKFMQRLDASIQGWILNNKNHPIMPSNIIYSPHTVRGEGEHKIFDYLRQGVVKDLDGAVVIHGLDADLIVVSCLMADQAPEPVSIMMYHDGQRLDIVSIDALRACIHRDLGGEEIHQSIRDFVLLSYLIGNDFLPHMVPFEHVGDSMRLMFRTYKQTKQPLTDDDGNIIWTNLAKFVQVLADQEPAMMKEVATKQFKYPSPAIEASTRRVKRADGGLNVTFNYDKFRQLWYDNALLPRTEIGRRILGREQAPQSGIDGMVEEFMRGMQWTFRYYTAGTREVSTAFIYKYRHAPLLVDLAAGMKAGGPTSQSVAFNPEDPQFTAAHQLVSVMPPSSIEFIPNMFRRLLLRNGLLADLSPAKFIVELEGKDQDYQGIVVLPPLDPVRVIQAMSTVNRGIIPKEFREGTDYILTDLTKRVRIPRVATKFEDGSSPPRRSAVSPSRYRTPAGSMERSATSSARSPPRNSAKSPGRSSTRKSPPVVALVTPRVEPIRPKSPMVAKSPTPVRRSRGQLPGVTAVPTVVAPIPITVVAPVSTERPGSAIPRGPGIKGPRELWVEGYLM